MKARTYACSMKQKRVWNLGFAEVSGMKCLICFAVICQWCIHTELGCLNDEYAADYVNWRLSCWLIGWWFNEWIDGVISFSLIYDELKYVEWVQSKNMMKSGFLPNWVSTLNPGVHVCCLCVMIYYVLTAHVYCLLNI